MTTSLVTGGAGFIGSHVVKHLLDMGHTVIVLDHLEWGDIGNISPFVTTSYDCWLKKILWTSEADDGNCVFVKGSITSPETVNRLFERWNFDYVFHLAAYAAEGLSPFIRRFNYENNLIGSVNLINAAINAGTVKRFVFVSSAAVYGYETGFFKTSERSEPVPCDPYGIAKYAIELDLRAASAMFGFEFAILRCHNVYGERQNLGDLYRNAVAIFMRLCLQGQPMTIFGDGSQTRQFSYIDDVAPYIVNAAFMPHYNGTYNIGSDRSFSVLDLAHAVARAVGVEPRLIYLPDRIEVPHVNVEHNSFQVYFKPAPETPLDEGLARMAAWARTQPLRQPRPFAAIEVERGLPESWRAYAGSTDAR